MRHFCTYFDSHYLLRGLSLFRSLEAHAGEFTLYVLCCDERAFEALQTLNIANLRAFRLAELEKFEPRLAQAKTNRTRVEYLWTLSPLWPRFLFHENPQIEMLTYLDADLYFYSSPEPIFEEIGDNSVAMFAHRFPPHLKYMEVNGVYNVGWLYFRRDNIASKCLETWGQECLEWCYDRAEGDKFGDQKYLDKWPDIYPKVKVLQHEGAGIAPWNWQNTTIRQRNEKLYSNDVPLIFFHFHGLKFLNSCFYDAVFAGHLYGEIPASLRRKLFGPYLRALIETARWARARGCEVEFGHLSFTKYFSSYGKRIFLSKLARRQIIFHLGLK